MWQVRHLEFPPAARTDGDGSDRADIGQALLRQCHAVGDMTWLFTIHIERKHRIRAALFGPADQPAERWLADLGTQQPAFGPYGSIADFRHGKNIANQVLAAF